MSSQTEHQLLYGVLALQMGMISRDALLMATRSWLADKSQRLVSILRLQEALSEEEVNLVASLVEHHLSQHDNDAGACLASLAEHSELRDVLLSLDDNEIDSAASRLGKGEHVRTDVDATISVAGDGSRPTDQFEIIRSHDKGGLGEVFVARDHELDRIVALKEIQRQHAEHTDSYGRFIQEAKITGKLEHPGVVPVYRLGAHTDGRPYYAMRFIKGRTLKEALQEFHQENYPTWSSGEGRLALRGLLTRFIDVCNTIAYAHSRGILHRDIKPANIILGKYGETLVVDWGLAKPLGQLDSADAESDETMIQSFTASDSVPTQLGSAMGTLAYMSPEQAAGDHDLLRPVSDVYSLGATLYHLLSGEVSHAARSDGNGSSDVADVLRKIQRGDFRKPREINSRIPLPLESICLKAMCSDPADRYQSAHEVAEELERYLANEPLVAHQETFREKLSRVSRRHQTLAQALVACLFVGLAVTAASAFFINQARQFATEMAEENEKLALSESLAREESDHVVEYLVSVLSSADPGKAGRSVTIAEALDHATLKLETELQDQPAVRARILRALGETYLGLGIYDAAHRTFQQEQNVLNSLHGPADPTTLQAMNDVVLTKALVSNLVEHTGHFERLLDERKKVLGDRHPSMVESMSNLAACYASSGRDREAVEMLEEAVEIWRIHGDAQEADLNPAAILLAIAYARVDQAPEKLSVFEELAGALLRSHGPDHARTMTANIALALIHQSVGNLDRALDLFDAVIKTRERTLGATHPQTMEVSGRKCYCLIDAGRVQTALDLAKRNWSTRLEHLGADHPYVLESQQAIITCLGLLGRDDAAGQEAARLLENSRRVFGEEHPRTWQARRIVASRTLANPLAELHEIWLACKETLGASHPATVESAIHLVKAQRATNDHSAGIHVLEEAVQALEATASQRNLLDLYTVLAKCYDANEDQTQAIETQQKAIEQATQKYGPFHGRTRKTQANLGLFYHRANRTGEAIGAYERAIQDQQNEEWTRDKDLISARANLASLYHRMGDDRRAAETLLPLLQVDVFGPASHSAERALVRLMEYCAATQLEDALMAGERALRLALRRTGEQSSDVAHLRNALAKLLVEANRPGDAAIEFSRLLTYRISQYGLDHDATASTINRVVHAMVQDGQPQAAMQKLQELEKRFTAELGADHSRTQGLQRFIMELAESFSQPPGQDQQGQE